MLKKEVHIHLNSLIVKCEYIYNLELELIRMLLTKGARYVALIQPRVYSESWQKSCLQSGGVSCLVTRNDFQTFDHPNYRVRGTSVYSAGIKQTKVL